MINPQVSSLSKSATLAITALTKEIKAQGKDVVNFAAGEPDFDTPEFIKAAAKSALDQGFTKYTPSSGDVRLKESIAAKLWKQNSISSAKENIVITSGAKYAIFIALLSLAKAGDEILVPSPYWVSYPEMIKLTNAKARFIELPEENGFKLTPELLRASINSKTKAIIFNYPSNPTGVTYSRQEIEAIASVVAEKGIYVISDEIYEVLTYDGKTHTSIASFDSVSKQVVTINGFSKTFAMTGWRVGYLAADKEIANEVSKITGHTTSCPCSIAQMAALAAFEDQDWEDKIRIKFKERRDLLHQGLSKVKKIIPFQPEGTFYMFCDIRETGLDSFTFCSRLLQERLVSCIPAAPFGKEGFIRVSFATSADQIAKGINRISDFINTI